ncbi:MAG TPA: class I SAM-dependent methyltransferase [Anaeromyxobacter sp.]|nr:class I SAM-dependent methyltransferase [Anaeromyxobacter sp.]
MRADRSYPLRVCTKPPLAVRLARAVNRQAAAPRGAFGRLLGVIWRREHARLNAEAIEVLDVRPDHHLLEVGSGPGEALREAVRRAPGGSVLGVDVSDVMVRLARRRNREAVARGVLDVRQIDGVDLGLEGRAFDRILSIHSIYFWRDLEGAIAQLAAALRPGGRILLGYRPDGDDIPPRFRDPIYRFPRPDGLEELLRRAGLVGVRTVPARAGGAAVFTLAERA